MQLAEFETTIQNGVITVPCEYLTFLSDKTKIMVRIESLGNEHAYKRSFEAVRINTKGIKFNREEANAR
jgi:hypothetical protein